MVAASISIIALLATLLVFAGMVAAVIVLIVWLVRRNNRPSPPPKVVPPIAPSITKRSCPQCGKELPANAPEGLCPACVMRVGIGSQMGSDTIVLPSTPPAPPEIAKHFPPLEIIELLGQGGMGMVYKARQKQLDRLVALKILRMESGRDPAFAERFSREAKALARLNHQNIVTVHDFGETDGFYFLLMEFVDGANLREVIRGQKIKPEEALKIVPPICEALQFAHEQGIVHRDIKPENILVDKQGRVKIADFGIAKILGTDKPTQPLTGAQQAIGTPHYMAPEQVEKPTTVDHRADIYSLGVVFYEMLTGELPLGRFAPPSQKVQVDVRLDEIVLRALEKEPERRYQTAGEVKTQVETIATIPAASAGQESAQVPHDPQWTIWEHRAPGWRVRCAKCGFIEHWGKYGIRKGAVGTTSKFGRCQNCRRFGWNVIEPGPVPKDQPAAAKVAFAAAESPREPRFSLMAIVGAVWAAFFFLAALFYFAVRVELSHPGNLVEPGKLAILLSFTLLPFGATAPFGTTILGWIAVGKIRRSAGRLHGLGLAVFDGLLFPLLALDFLINVLGAGAYQIWGTIARGTSQVQYREGVLLVVDGVVILACIVVDFLIARAVWRAVNKPLNGATPPASSALSGKKEKSANTPLAFTAIFFAALSGVLGTISFFFMPQTPPVLVWSILICALLGIFLGIASRQTSFGKGAIAVGGINTVIWMVITIVLCFRQSPLPFGSSDRAEVRYRVFEADTELVNRLVPSATRQRGDMPDSDEINGKTKQIGAPSNATSQKAEINSTVLDSLLSGMSAEPGLLIDRDRNIPFAFWPRLADGHSYVRTNGVGSVGGFVALRREKGVLQLRVQYQVTHMIEFRDSVRANIFYEGNAPQPGSARVFFIPCKTDRYLVIAFDVNGSKTTTNKSISKPAIVRRGAEPILMDDKDAVSEGAWTEGSMATDKYGSTYLHCAAISPLPQSSVTYRPKISAPGKYDVEIWFPQGTNRSTHARWIISCADGESRVLVDQTTNGGRWIKIAGDKTFRAEANDFVRLVNNTPGLIDRTGQAVVVADAVRLVPCNPVPEPIQHAGERK